VSIPLAEDIEHRVAPLADLTSAYGTYFVTGNHKYHAGAPEWSQHLGDLGIRVLRNELVEVERERSHSCGRPDPVVVLKLDV
jgi:predicted MPP superfamily phosphohydrolase